MDLRGGQTGGREVGGWHESRVDAVFQGGRAPPRNTGRCAVRYSADQGFEDRVELERRRRTEECPARVGPGDWYLSGPGQAGRLLGSQSFQSSSVGQEHGIVERQFWGVPDLPHYCVPPPHRR